MQQGDLDACAELLTENFIINLPGLPEPLHGREIWKAGVQAMLDGFPDLRITIEDISGAGDRVAVRMLFTGTHTGSFQDVPATHRQWRSPASTSTASKVTSSPRSGCHPT
ncbi:ester cyclase [Actinoplanes auranticolor]|uniref:Ester cyclase n=1 Tax=Actinoplanes auranticolor TaxID=47988 RepID=A0A919SBA8_9ACTN|nr:ester cyclase [Actinoplanes auranticolor]GIM67815.1 hypothetical protein Aau02nite_28970 [Actinoplanes auranticolor]